MSLAIRATLPEPDCTLGYTCDQVEAILGTPRRIKKFERWMYGQTIAICDGPTPYAHHCLVAHHEVIYRHDLERWLARLPGGHEPPVAD